MTVISRVCFCLVQCVKERFIGIFPGNILQDVDIIHKSLFCDVGTLDQFSVCKIEPIPKVHRQILCPVNGIGHCFRDHRQHKSIGDNGLRNWLKISPRFCCVFLLDEQEVIVSSAVPMIDMVRMKYFIIILTE